MRNKKTQTVTLTIDTPTYRVGDVVEFSEKTRHLVGIVRSAHLRIDGQAMLAVGGDVVAYGEDFGWEYMIEICHLVPGGIHYKPSNQFTVRYSVSLKLSEEDVIE
jgi:hypothetical protein